MFVFYYHVNIFFVVDKSQKSNSKKEKKSINGYKSVQKKNCIRMLAYRWQYSNRNTVELESLAGFGVLAR